MVLLCNWRFDRENINDFEIERYACTCKIQKYLFVPFVFFIKISLKILQIWRFLMGGVFSQRDNMIRIYWLSRSRVQSFIYSPRQKYLEKQR